MGMKEFRMDMVVIVIAILRQKKNHRFLSIGGRVVNKENLFIKYDRLIIKAN